MRCHWANDPEIGKWWYPHCYGGLYGPEGCYCPREKPKKDQMAELEKRIAKLETLVPPADRAPE